MRTPAKIEAQIKALEYVLRASVNQNKSQQTLFALNGKLRKLRIELAESRKQEWLGK